MWSGRNGQVLNHTGSHKWFLQENYPNWVTSVKLWSPCEVMPATTSTTGLTETLWGGTRVGVCVSVCVCAQVCGITHQHVHLGALQKKRVTSKDQKKKTTPSQYTHIQQPGGPPTAQSTEAPLLCCTLHTQTHPHICHSLAVCSKCQEQGAIMSQCH